MRAEELHTSDLTFIAAAAHPEIPPKMISAMVAFNLELHAKANGTFAHAGRPWEFNLRDVFRWCGLMRRYQSPSALEPAQFIGPLYLSRLRSQNDREKAATIYETSFADVYNTNDKNKKNSAYKLETQAEVPYRLTSTQLQIGAATLARHTACADTSTNSSNTVLIPGLLRPMEAAMYAVEMGWMVLLTGNQATGKTSIVRTLAGISGKTLREMTLSADSDTSDLLGSFEQVELEGRTVQLLARIAEFGRSLASRIVGTKNMHQGDEYVFFLKFCLAVAWRPCAMYVSTYAHTHSP